MTRRAGITLTESLVALFVAALGMISLLVLFPLGAIQLGQALKDERTSQCAQKADALIRAHWQSEVIERASGVDGDSGAANINRSRGADPFVLALNDPNANATANAIYTVTVPGAPPTTTTTPLSVFPASGWVSRTTMGSVGTGVTDPSFPVFIDPIGWQTRTLNTDLLSRTWLAGTSDTSVTNIPRRTLRTNLAGGQGFINNSTLPASSLSIYDYGAAGNFKGMVEYCTLLDDMSYGPGGDAGVIEDGAAASTARVDRLGRYNWAAVIQRPSNNIKYVANLTILVFENRPPAFLQPGSELIYPRDNGIPNTPANAVLNTIVLNPGATSFTINYLGDPPPITKGRWIMDGTIATGVTATLNPPGAPVAGTQPIRNANFYRVVSVTDTPPGATPGTLVVEIQPPIQQPLGSRAPAPAGVFPTTQFVEPNTGQSGYAGQIYVLQNLSEVFIRPTLQP